MPVFHLDHKLADFDKWISVFKEGTPRKEIGAKHGVKSLRVLHDANDRNHAIVVMEAESRASIDGMMAEPQVQERFADTSLFAEPPKVNGGYEASDLEAFPVDENPAFFVDHRLLDYDKWFAVFSAHRTEPNELRDRLGIKLIRLLHDIEDNNHAILVVMAPDRAAVEQLIAGPRVQETIAKGDIFRQPPEITGQFSGIAA